jgi:hypothetical protein
LQRRFRRRKKTYQSLSIAFLFLEETGFTREDGKVYPLRPSGFIQNRVATYFPGTRVAHIGGLKAAVSDHRVAYLSSLGSPYLAPLGMGADFDRVHASNCPSWHLSARIFWLVRELQHCSKCVLAGPCRGWGLWVLGSAECSM